MKRARTDDGGAFRFFEDAAPAIPDPPPPARAAALAARRAAEPARWLDGDEFAEVLWERGAPAGLGGGVRVPVRVHDAAGARDEPRDAARARLRRTPRDDATRALVQGHATHAGTGLVVIDTVAGAAAGADAPSGGGSGGGSAGAGAAGAHPLSLEPGLAPLVWPLSERDFIDRHWARAPLCVHAAASRTRPLLGALGGRAGASGGGGAGGAGGFDAQSMIAASSRAVVWMREAVRDDEPAGGAGVAAGRAEDAPAPRVAYLDSPPGVAVAAWRAGHTVYFNPPPEAQAPVVRALARALGLDGWPGLDGGGGGGDVEVFAVRGPHATAWHFDCQDNFTVQLTGTKRWHVAPPDGFDDDRRATLPPAVGEHANAPADAPANGLTGAPADAPADAPAARRVATAPPVTNLHPSAVGEAALERDAAALAVTGGACAGAPPPRAALDARAACVVLRPGSTLYVPAGWWHAVDAEEAGGSLSLNVSLSGVRWADVLLRRLAPALMAADARWRERARAPARGAPAEAARAAEARLRDMLRRAGAALAGLPPAAMLPPPARRGARRVLALRGHGWRVALAPDAAGAAGRAASRAAIARARRGVGAAARAADYLREHLESVGRVIGAHERGGAAPGAAASAAPGAAASDAPGAAARWPHVASSFSSAASLTLRGAPGACLLLVGDARGGVGLSPPGAPLDDAGLVLAVAPPGPPAGEPPAASFFRARALTGVSVGGAGEPPGAPERAVEYTLDAAALPLARRLAGALARGERPVVAVRELPEGGAEEALVGALLLDGVVVGVDVAVEGGPSVTLPLPELDGDDSGSELEENDGVDGL